MPKKIENLLYESDDDCNLSEWKDILDEFEVESDNSWETESDSDVDSEDSITVSRKRKRAKRLSSSDSVVVDTSSNYSEEWIWEDKDNIPEISQFSEVPGINPCTLRKLGNNPDALSVLQEVLQNDFWDMLSKETNLYAEQVQENQQHNKTKLLKEWFPVTPDEIRGFFALSVIMSQVKKPQVQWNWSKRAIIHTPIFAETMPFKRFLGISHFLHFSNNRETESNDRIRKVRIVLTYLNNRFRQLYTPKCDVAVDESLMKYKGRLSYIQFNPSKRARFGIKFYKICESESGYCLGFKIYAGQDKCSAREISASESIVMDLMEPFLGKGYTLFIDNWYSSPSLYLNLKKNRTNVVGTVRRFRKNMPKGLAALKLKKGEFQSRSSRGLLCLRWRDKKDVYILSTKHSNVNMINTEKKRYKKDGGVENVVKPECVNEYNKGMGGVDKQDQVLACFPIMRKFMKGYKKIFFYMVDIALYNAHVLHSKIHGRKQNFTNFRLDIAEQLLSKIVLPNYNTRGHPSQGDTPLRLQAKNWSHFPEHVPQTSKKQNPSKRCHVCAKHNIRSETTWQCKRCKVPLHLPTCFEQYHTLHEY